MLIVQKYGGTSVGSIRRIQAAAQRIRALAEAGNRMVIVVSAQGDTTDAMLAKAVQIAPEALPREMDAYLSAGEQMSAALLAMAIGPQAVSLTGWQAGIHTDSCYQNAAIRFVDPARIRRELSAGRIVVTAGFQGIDDDGNITTLGRGGSDTTAVALAAAMNADKCQIYTDVDGVYDKDPRKFPDARPYKTISYGDMLSLARSGAQVLHDRCVEMAMEKGVIIEVLSAFEEKPGTIVRA